MSTNIDTMERAVIGAVLDPSRRGLIDDLDLTPEDFGDIRCEHVFHKAQVLAQRGVYPDPATMDQAIREDPGFDVRGVDFEWLYDCYNSNTSFSLVGDYVAAIRDEAVRRRLRTIARRITQAADENHPVADLVDMARREIDAAAHVDTTGLVGLGESMRATLNGMLEAPRYVPTPWDDLNDLVGGFRPGAMYVVGARPAVGKSVVALQAARALAQHGYVSFSSLEMGRDEINKRIIAHDLRINLRKIMDHDLTQTEWAQINDHMKVWDASKLMVNADSVTSFAALRQHARSVARKGNLSGVVVDYLQLMKGERNGNTPRHEVVAELSRSLKLLAMELDVPVIALSQLNRESANGEDKMPRISQLRESGAVEQDADMVILLHRELDGPNKYDLKLLVAKNRQGPTGVVELDFYGQYSDARSK